MNRITDIWSNRTIVSMLCFIAFLLPASAQTPDNSATNETPGENIETNVMIAPAPAVPVVYGAEPNPYQFETQNNMPVLAGPTYAGSGVVGSPLMGTSSFIGGGGIGAPTGQGIYSGGNLRVHLGLGYTFDYATGLESQPGQHSAVISQGISATLTMSLGNHWTLSYSPALATYNAGSGFSDSVSQSVTLAGSTSYEGWNLGLSESYSLSDAPTVQTGTQTEEEASVSSVSMSHSLGNSFNFAIGLNQSSVLANQFSDVYTYGGTGSLNYILSPRLQVGLDAGLTYDSASVGPRTTSESYQAVLMARLGPKMTLNLSGGIEESSFSGPGDISQLTPIFAASISYELGQKTALSLNASRALSPTFFSNQVSTSTSVGVLLTRSLSKKLQVSLSGDYTDTSYQTIEPGMVSYGIGTLPVVTTSALEVAREDHSTSFYAGLTYAFRARLSASVSYGWSENSSGDSSFSYTSSQVGFSMSYMY